MNHIFNVGDIVVHQWSMPSDDIYFYQVVKKTPKGVRIRKIKQRNLTPLPNQFDDDNIKGKFYKVGINPFKNKPAIVLPTKWIPFDYMYKYEKRWLLMPIEQLFSKYLNKNTNVDDAINELTEIIDAELDEYEDSDNQYLNVLGNEIKGFKDNDNFYLTGINKHQFDYQQFDY